MTEPPAEAEVRHDPAAGTFSIDTGGHTGVLRYRLDHGAMVIVHTGVPSAIGGRGIAGRLVEAAVREAREAGLEVDPRCSYAAAWLRRNPG